MVKQFFVFWILLSVFVGHLHCYAESCYFCSGTHECTDPMDYREVSKQKCIEEDSHCIKLVLSTKNEWGHLIGNHLAYRRCFYSANNEEDICADVRTSEEKAVAYFNYSLAAFKCDSCNKTDCNAAIIKNCWSVSIIILFVIVHLARNAL